METTTVEQVADWLDGLLKPDAFEDAAWNGLQVGNSGRLGVVCAGVDASLAFFEAAAKRGAGMVICHHGISWGDSLKTLTGLNYRLVSFLMQHDLALWASHLPLDAHPVLGNNARIAHRMGLMETRPFCEYHGQKIGVQGVLPKAATRTTIVRRVQQVTQAKPQVMPFGKDVVRSIGIVSGGAAAEIAQAAEAGLDLYLSGEPTLQAYNLAEQLGINAVFAGHYATERFGIRALAAVLRTTFRLQTAFVDFGIPY